MVGEVSAVNDDDTDNRFYEPLPRFSTIEEDEPPYYLLCTDYPDYYQA
jgi:D-lyxose ketol-isomerase